MEVIATMTGLKQQETASEAGVALLGKALDTQQVLAAQLLQSMGIGQNLDVTV
jgi:hypothetical protein